MRRDAAACFAMSWPGENRYFSRRWAEPEDWPSAHSRTRRPGQTGDAAFGGNGSWEHADHNAVSRKAQQRAAAEVLFEVPA